MSDRELLLSFIASLTLCDHMGDVSDDISSVLKKMGEVELLDAYLNGDEFSGLAKALVKRGITTLYGTKLGADDGGE